MKILLLGFAKIKFMPYVTFYLDQIDLKKNETHVVYWNRDLKDEDLSGFPNIHFHEFRRYMEDSIAKRLKLKHFWAYRKFVKSILHKERFDVIISLHTLPGLLILNKLCKEYRHRYILDYRDSTFEERPFFGRIVKKLARNSKLVFVSSDGFRKFLPEDSVEIITSHNILKDSLEHRNEHRERFIPSDKIRLSFWGLIRHAEHNKLIIDRLANDPRFELHYYGRELQAGKLLREYCKAHSILNVFLHGEYVPKDRYEFVRNTDIIHNNYFDSNMLLAMGNKYYDGIIFRVPQLCMPGSYMAKRCEEKGVGCAFDPRDVNFADKIYEYYQHLDWSDFEKKCDEDLEEILTEYTYGVKKVKELLNS